MDLYYILSITCHGYYFHLIDNKANHLLIQQIVYQLLKMNYMFYDIIHDTIEVLYFVIINICNSYF